MERSNLTARTEQAKEQSQRSSPSIFDALKDVGKKQKIT